MKIAIVHYHLRQGGVTRVIEQQSKALTNLGIEHLILCGDAPASTEIPHIVIEGLDYSSDRTDGLLDKMHAACMETFGEPPSIWHFHNYSIGKNIQYPEIVNTLANNKDKLLLQIHDFVEDGRAHNLENISSIKKLYPLGSHIQYATINSRDKNLLEISGVQHPVTLPNACEAPLEDLNSSTNVSDHLESSIKPYLFYPVRCVRRKNIGEAILISLLIPEKYNIALASAPIDEPCMNEYSVWEDFCSDYDLRVLFNVVGNLSPSDTAQNDFAFWYAHADCIITTSIQEGFGMAYIEPIIYGKKFIGRNLPEITPDLEDLHSNTMYDGCYIPTQYVDPDLLQTKHEEYSDFGNLPESEQKRLIEEIINEKITLSEIKLLIDGRLTTAEPWISQQLARDKTQYHHDDISPWSPLNVQKEIYTIYKNLLASDSSSITFANQEKIQEFFSAPRRFHHLKIR